MKLIFIISFFFISSISFSQVLKVEKTRFSIGETIKFQSMILSEERILNIYLPNGYSPDSAKTYPVIYLLDGSFDEDFIHISGVVQYLTFTWLASIPECIVVGIANVDRQRDFTWPSNNEQDKKEFPTTGGSANFIQFIEKEVISTINENYKVNNDRTIIGQSLGGLLATEILYKKNDLFNRYIIVSPSTWWDNQSILDAEYPGFLNATAVYIAVGGQENKQMISGAKKLYSRLLKAKSGNAKSNGRSTNWVHFKCYADLNHGNILHTAAYDGLLNVFNRSWRYRPPN